jgi:peptidoglycan lytic transglycosylase
MIRPTAVLLALTLPLAACKPVMSRLVGASWYSSGAYLADGERFNPDNPHICANKTLSFGTRLRVTNPQNGRTLRCVVRDRGPFVRGRSLDVSRAGAEALGFRRQGVARLRVQVISSPSEAKAPVNAAVRPRPLRRHHRWSPRAARTSQ